MDPNTGKKDMFNKLSKKQGIQLLNQETFKRKTISFYRYVIIDNPHKLRDTLNCALIPSCAKYILPRTPNSNQST